LRIKDLIFYRPHVEALKQRLVAWLRERGEISPSGFKELVGQSRKFSIPLAEHFDAEKVTLRVGDARRLREK
jgi:selenocysteine-specific elongation factor